MAQDAVPLNAGKLPADLLARLLADHVSVDDPSVLVAPAPGFDAAVVRPGDDIIVKSDPITFATAQPATYLVAVNANDIACLGGVPRWMTATALFPEGTTEADVTEVFDTLAVACRRIGVALIGGHTEVTPAVRQLVLSGTLIGLPGIQGTLAPGGAQPGDEVWITQAAGIEGTSIIATEVPREQLAGVSEWAIEVGRNLLDNPGISVVEAARTAREAGEVTAMHDPTEGGVATALHELADASGLGIEVDIDAIPVWPVTRALTDRFDISPLGLISSGALLFTATPGQDATFEAAFDAAGIPVTRIGRMLPDPDSRIARAGGSTATLPRYDADEITRVFAGIQAATRGQVVNQVEIIVYGRERFSPDLARVRDRLMELDLLYQEHDIEADDTASDALEDMTGKRQVPTVVIGHRVLVEPSIEELDFALRDAGFSID